MKRLSVLVTFLTLALPAVAEAGTRASVRLAAWRLPFTSSDLLLLVGGMIAAVVAGVLAKRLTTLADPARPAPARPVSGSAFGSDRSAAGGLAQAAGGR